MSQQSAHTRQRSLRTKVVVGIGGCVLAAIIAYAPTYLGLTEPARHALFVLLAAAWLWISEALPAFAVSLSVVAMLVVLLGDPSGAFAAGNVEAWQMFVAPWASPVMWLFLAGLMLGSAAAKTGLDRLVAARVIGTIGGGDRRTLLGVMLVTFVLSMFMSNTATTAMMLVIVGRIAAGMAEPLAARGMMLSVPVAANIGGMATVIGSPPNAIAIGALHERSTIDFGQWMLVGFPPALVLVTIAYWYLLSRYLPSRTGTAAVAQPVAPDVSPAADRLPTQAGQFRLAVALTQGMDVIRDDARRERLLTGLVIAVTIVAWITEAWHGIPTAVIAVMPIAALAVGGVITERELRSLPWDVLILLAGGLALGVGVTETGLARWIAGGLLIDGLPLTALMLLVALMGVVLSNLISNTAAATVLMPIALAVGAASGVGADVPLVLALALTLSAGMCLPISTPPNALTLATGLLSTQDLLRIGLLIGVAAPVIVVPWVLFVAPMLAR